MRIKLVDNAFANSMHVYGFDAAADGVKPSFITWDRHIEPENDLVIFTDARIFDSSHTTIKSKHKVGWLIEPRSIAPQHYDMINNFAHNFNYILTHDRVLLEYDPNKYIKQVIGSSRIKTAEQIVYNKSCLCSMIASNKRMAPGHILRHEIAAKFKSQIDLYGSGYQAINDKLIGLKDYMFSIAIMNGKLDYFFTEVLIDLFLTGTIPIFWGCPKIGDFFDTAGIITFDTINELDAILQNINIELYNSMLNSIYHNFELAKKYISTDDLVAQTLINLELI